MPFVRVHFTLLRFHLLNAATYRTIVCLLVSFSLYRRYKDQPIASDKPTLRILVR